MTDAVISNCPSLPFHPSLVDSVYESERERGGAKRARESEEKREKRTRAKVHIYHSTKRN